MTFDLLGLRAELLQAVGTKGYTAPTPIQAKAIPVILAGRDIMARAQTGTGKTDAFALPMVEILSRKKGGGRHPRALVLAPTRELALQVGESIKAYARRVSLRCTVVHGGVQIQAQIERLKRGVDILVATPGRLLDLAGQRQLNLSRVEFLVFDEADRMLDLGFSEEIAAVLDLVPAQRRTVLFSATYTQPIRELAGRMLRTPEFIEVTPGNTAAEAVVQKVHLVDRTNKITLLGHLLAKGKWSRTLIFTRTKYGADDLVEKLAARGVRALALHGNKSQSFRTRTLDEFRRGEIRILVATDLAARGLDISNLPLVVNYDLPAIPEDYVHRIGRTGRAGVSGLAVSLVCPEEKPQLRAIEELLRQKIPVARVEGFTVGHDLPDYVLFRPNSATSEKKAAREIRQLVAARAAAKERARTLKAKGPGGGKGAGSEAPAKSRPKGKNAAGHKSAGPGSRSRRSAKPGKTKGKR
jgi:ATP-dependent RNA helicase RhlE